MVRYFIDRFAIEWLESSLMNLWSIKHWFLLQYHISLPLKDIVIVGNHFNLFLIEIFQSNNDLQAYGNFYNKHLK
jgi:hypothetical protein